MAMFSLGMVMHHHQHSLTSLNSHTGIKFISLTGLFMATRPSIIACGTRLAAVAMALKFLLGPAVMGAASLACGLRGKLFKVAFVQVPGNFMNSVNQQIQ